MTDRMILSPYFLDKKVAGFETLASGKERWLEVDMPAGTQLERIAAVHHALADEVAHVIANDQRPVSIVGDCCTTIGMLGGLQWAGIRPQLVWLDAHGDFNTTESSPSGFLGGMPLAMIVGRGDQNLILAQKLSPVHEADVILSDARDLDALEAPALKNSEVNVVADVEQLPEVVSRDHPIYLHFDTDIIDPNEAPAMAYPAVGGPSSEVLTEVFSKLAKKSNIVAISMTHWDPERPGAGKTGEICMQLLDTLLEDR